jgi:hypothetical protein
MAVRVGFGRPHGIENTEVVDSTMRWMSTNRWFGGFAVQKQVQDFNAWRF